MKPTMCTALSAAVSMRESRTVTATPELSSQAKNALIRERYFRAAGDSPSLIVFAVLILSLPSV